MAQINCKVSNKQFEVKKICKVAEMPMNAKYYYTCYNDNGVFDIFRTDSGVFYAKPPRIY